MDRKIFTNWNIYQVLCLLIVLTSINITWATTKKLTITKSPAVATGINPNKFISTTASTTTSTTINTPTMPTICLEGIRPKNRFNIDINDLNTINDEDLENFVEIIEGDAIMSVLTKDPTSVLFVINRINEANLLIGGFEIGVRAINIIDSEQIQNILLQEIEFLQNCIEFPIGIFLDNDLYQLIKHLIDDLEYNIWTIPSTRGLLFPKVVHLLYQMPWGDRSASVEIVSENPNVYNDFMNAARNEHLCLMHFHTTENIYVLLGNKLVSNFKENGTIFAVPTGRTDKSFIADLPGNSYVLMESEVELKIIDENSTQSTLHETLIGKNILSSELLAISKPLLNIIKWLNNSLIDNCNTSQGVVLIETCKRNFLEFIHDFSLENNVHYKPNEILELLKIKKLRHLMTFEMFQKVIMKHNDSEESVQLREIASQNFITNITTYFHYNRVNETTHEMKSKFGQVFNCQFADGTNRKFPFYHEGESVMYWRLKPEAWVAAGLTASILGVIISLAILIFVIIRITIGDVFEGNPLSSITLLISLIILFSSFVPFAIEYVSDHRNSHITYKDAEIMNTLCAVRIFLITLCYCITFSLLLCRALMLASIGSEGGFLSHVNGYIQSVICVFSTLVQLGLSMQLLIVMHIANESISCQNIFYGHWLWGVLTYDFLLLLFLVFLSPFIFRSQRNYREGILLVVSSILCLIIWCAWIPMCYFGTEWRDAAIPLGVQATGWAILTSILIPRSFLIVRGIERSDIAQALPSLTSLAFAQNNQYNSEQSVYECVNPAMRHCGSREDGMCEVGHRTQPQSPSEIPTLPLRGGGGGGAAPRRQIFGNLRNNINNVSTQRRQSYSSSQSSLPPSPNKITRF